MQSDSAAAPARRGDNSLQAEHRKLIAGRHSRLKRDRAQYRSAAVIDAGSHRNGHVFTQYRSAAVTDAARTENGPVFTQYRPLP